MNSRKYTIFSILFLFFLSALMMIRQLKSPGYFSCVINDTFAYTSWAGQFIEALKEGIIYPRWTPLNFWGYGSPTFILYPPLAFYLVAFFNFFTDSIIVAMNITKFTALLLSAMGIFFLVREFYSEKIALLTAIFYLILPYHIFQFYCMGTFASMISFLWFAPVLLFTYTYIKNRYYKDIIYAGACYGGLILTHLLNAYMFTFVIIAFIIYMSLAKKRPKDLIIIAYIILIGFLISGAYVLPLICERQFINIKASIGEGGSGFHFHDFFILPNLTGKFSLSHFWPYFYNEYLFHVLFFCIPILLFLIPILKLNHIKSMENVNIVNKFFMGLAIGSIFLLFGASTFVWETIPFFKYIQFPFRWLNITAFAVVFLSSAIFWVLGDIYKSKRRHKYFITLLFLVCLLLAYSLSLDYKYIRLANIFTVKELMPVKTVNWTVEHLPVGVDIEKIDKNVDKERIVITRGEGKAEIVAWKSAERIIEVTANQPLTLRIRTFNFPGWKAYIDGTEISITTEEGIGAMLIDIPEGKHTLLLKFVDTPIRFYAKIISFISCLIIALLVLLPKKKIDRDIIDFNDDQGRNN